MFSHVSRVADLMIREEGWKCGPALFELDTTGRRGIVID